MKAQHLKLLEDKKESTVQALARIIKNFFLILERDE